MDMNKLKAIIALLKSDEYFLTVKNTPIYSFYISKNINYSFFDIVKGFIKNIKN